MAYHRSNKEKNKRYYYFKEVDHIRGLAGALTPGVSCAADAHNIGLGKLLAIQYVNRKTNKKEIRLAIVADTGGAFKNNLYQIDLFTGTFANKQSFNNYIKPFPRMTHAYILIKK